MSLSAAVWAQFVTQVFGGRSVPLFGGEEEDRQWWR